ncbi:RNA polymerase sigma factor [Fulvivirga sp. M361]|uniref:RNA polymerase sigma factor n=1 Tax=Fulvivirga sp. M361 TaxID=2594266 RepID=UPI00117A4A9B|nr:RNA polymerase sigma factor [Fulvivirga sp. M361]TRX51598.1 RNA polymerase sigma factor [Fulvivirga sp. M361]
MTEREQKLIFDHWLKDYRSLLFKVVRSYAFTADDQEDLFQDIIIQVWRSVPNYRKESAVSTWLYRVSLNTAIKWMKKERKHQDGRQSMEHVAYVLKESVDEPDERLTWLYEEIGKLNEIDRSITLLLLDGFSYKEMSNIIGITESNVGVKINRIKKYLITKSEKYDHYGV